MNLANVNCYCASAAPSPCSDCVSPGAAFAASDVPESVPSYKSFEHIRNPKARRAKDYEQFLLFASDRFPEFRARIEPELAWARSQAERKSSTDRDRVLHVLTMGEATRREVADDLNIPVATAYKILCELVCLQLAHARPHPGIAGNKPYLVYSLAP